MDNQTIDEAKQALHKNGFASFNEQAPALRQLLQHLPLLPPQSKALQTFANKLVQRGDLEETMAQLKKNWRAYNPPNSHEGAVSVVIGEEGELLTAVFHTEVWGMTSEQSRLAVARVGEANYLFWSTR
jgi:hypothetical protein